MSGFLQRSWHFLGAVSRSIRSFAATMRNKLFAGVVVAIPVVVTIWVLHLAYTFISGISSPFLDQFKMSVPGLSFGVTLILLIALGIMATNLLGQRVIRFIEQWFMRIPVVATIYTAVKQIIDSFKSFNDVSNFKRVVYIDYPTAGGKLIGLVTGQFYDQALGCEMTALVIPTAPNPMTGLVMVVETSKVYDSGLSLEDAMKLIVSAGLVVPRRKATAPLQRPTPAAVPEPVGSPAPQLYGDGATAQTA